MGGDARILLPFSACPSRLSSPFAIPVPAPLAPAPQGVSGEPEAVLNPKKKQFDTLAPGLKTDAKGVAGYNGIAFTTSKGPCTAPLLNAHIK